MAQTTALQPNKQAWSAKTYQDNAGFVPTLGAAVLDWLRPGADQNILDLGCGDGVLTLELIAAGARVVGVDASPDFVTAARAKGIDARLCDGCNLPFDRDFDAVFSNAAIHWMSDPAAVVAGVRRALRPGGRFVAEFGGHGNVAAIVTALHAVASQFDLDPALAKPWYFPTEGAYRTLLEQHGFAVDRIALIPRPTPLPTGLKGWLATFRAPLFDAAGDQRAAALDFAQTLLAPALRADDGRWIADYVRLRFEAHLVDHGT